MRPREGRVTFEPAVTKAGERGMTIVCTGCKQPIGTYGGRELAEQIATRHTYACPTCDAPPKAKA